MTIISHHKEVIHLESILGCYLTIDVNLAFTFLQCIAFINRNNTTINSDIVGVEFNRSSESLPSNTGCWLIVVWTEFLEALSNLLPNGFWVVPNVLARIIVVLLACDKTTSAQLQLGMR